MRERALHRHPAAHRGCDPSCGRNSADAAHQRRSFFEQSRWRRTIASSRKFRRDAASADSRSRLRGQRGQELRTALHPISQRQRIIDRRDQRWRPRHCADEPRRTFARCSDERHAIAPGFNHDIAERFAPRRVHTKIGGVEQRGAGRCASRETSPVRPRRSRANSSRCPRSGPSLAASQSHKSRDAGAGGAQQAVSKALLG